ncbi:MAG: ABC transporter substrate-binding protein [Gammaproteobacteria bacterium]
MKSFNKSAFQAAIATSMLAIGLGAGVAIAAEAAAPAAPAAVPADDPGKLVQASAEGLLKELDANRDAYRKDPAKMSALIDKWLLPHFDTQYSARLVLAKHWRDATEDQRKRFVNAFYQSLLRNYGTALADFTSDRMKFLPAQVDGDTATVRTEIKRSNGTRIPVNYSLRKTPDGWKAWDVVIEGISYVKSFREDFGSEIDQKGLDAVIQRIEKGGLPNAPGKA